MDGLLSLDAEIAEGAPEEKKHADGGGHRDRHEEIARLAHRYWEARGRSHGEDLDDWLRAEREVNSRHYKRRREDRINWL